MGYKGDGRSVKALKRTERKLNNLNVKIAEAKLLLKEKASGAGECRQWILQEGDYMRAVQWTWHMDMTGHNGV